jgi:hypothetical protein
MTLARILTSLEATFAHIAYRLHNEACPWTF